MNALIALHYAFRCQGTAFQRHQSNRIIVYILKNTQNTMESILKQYEDEEERIEMRRIIQQRIGDIRRIQEKERMKKNGKNGIKGKHGKPVVSGNHLSVAGYSAASKKDSDRLELLERALSNNSIGTVDQDSDEHSETY